jgi:hypothetical protein
MAITFQNLLDDKFNIASKIKLLILSLVRDISIKGVFYNLTFYILSWIGLVYILSYITDNYIKVTGLEVVNENVFISYIFLASLLIMFIIYTYGINDSYKKNKRKLMLYGLSTIIVSVSTLNSIESMYKDKIGYTNVFTFQFFVLLFALILSVDRVASNITTLINEFSKKYCADFDSNFCDCLASKITFDLFFSGIKKLIILFFIRIKNGYSIFYSYFSQFKKLSITKKLLVLAYIFIFAPALMYSFFKFFSKYDYLTNQVNIDKLINSTIYSIDRISGYSFSKITLMLFKLLGIILIILIVLSAIIASIICIKRSISRIKYLITTSVKVKNINFEEIYRMSMRIFISVYALNLSLVTVFAFLFASRMKIVGTIVEIVFIMDLFILLLSILFKIVDKALKRIEVYKKSLPSSE